MFEGKALSLVVLDGADEGVVISGAVGGNLAQQEIKMA